METTTIDPGALLAGTHAPGAWTLAELACAIEAVPSDAREELDAALDAMLTALGVSLHAVGVDRLDVLENLSDEVRGRSALELDVLDGRERGFCRAEDGEAFDYMLAHSSYRTAHVVTEDAGPVDHERARVRFGRTLLALS